MSAWCRLLATRGFAISPRKWSLAATVTVAACGNSLLGALDRAATAFRVSRTAIPTDPTFIVGHWRTGTTLLHEWLDIDPQNRCPSTYECLAPVHFLASGARLKGVFQFLLPRRRPMDYMRVGFDRPQEDEAALCNLGAESSFLMVAFPHAGPCGDAYVTLDELSDRQRQRWADRHRRFLRRLVAARPGRLVLKSPQHTFRACWLRQFYPQARFIYVTRNPYEVFPSTVHFWKTMFHNHGLQTPPHLGGSASEAEAERALEEYVLETFQAMHQRWEQTCGDTDPHRVATVRYEQLTTDPLATLQNIYEQFGWEGFEGLRPRLEQHAALTAKFKRNRFELTQRQKDEVGRRWRAYFERHGYPL